MKELSEGNTFIVCCKMIKPSSYERGTPKVIKKTLHDIKADKANASIQTLYLYR